MSEGEGDYRTSIDRIGLALAGGAGLAGLVASGLVIVGGEASARAALVALLVGTLFALLAITVIAGPVWLLLHLSGQRGPAAAAWSGALVGFLLMVAAHFGRVTDEPWLHVFGGALLAAALAGVIALVMWSIAYRR